MKDFLLRLFDWAILFTICYISGWLMFLKPLVEIMNCDVVTGGMIVGLILKIAFAAPVARLIAYVGAIIAIEIF